MKLPLYLIALALTLGVIQGCHPVVLNNVPPLNFNQALQGGGLQLESVPGLTIVQEGN